MPLEILAPAGGEESLVAAVACGAHAVYLGGEHLNARRGAKNFDSRTLERAAAYCRARGVKVYLALNTLVLERERGQLINALRTACGLGMDAVIVQDLSVAALVRDACPGLPMHASTQMSVTGPMGARALESLGFSRMVLPREATLEEIRAIHASCGLELEVFVHGAHCMSVSGQCYMSAVLGGRSGNRGLCAQPCRLPFRRHSSCGIERKELDYALSLKDLSLIGRLRELEAAGVRSLKIEGRMKRPEYVAGAVTACRKALDGQEYDLGELSALFSRSGFTQGYLDGARDAAMFGVRRKEDVDGANPALLGKYSALYQKEQPRVRVDFRLTLSPDAPARLEASDRDGNVVEIKGAVPAPAVNSPTDAQRARSSLCKTGGTVFAAGEVHCDIAPLLMLPASALNALRREALDRLMALREAPQPIAFCEKTAAREIPHRRERPSRPKLRLRLARAEQLAGLSGPEHANLEMISLPLGELETLAAPGLSRYRKLLAAELPWQEFGGCENLPSRLCALRGKGVTTAIAGHLGMIRACLEAGLAPHGSYSLNITNSHALEEYRLLGLRSATLSFELPLTQAVTLGGQLPRGLLAYGYLPLMQLRNCPARALGGCDGDDCGYPQLGDRKGKKFALHCENRLVALYNCVPLWMADHADDLSGLDFATLYFTRESSAQVAKVLRMYAEGAPPVGEFTRGLYYRAVK